MTIAQLQAAIATLQKQLDAILQPPTKTSNLIYAKAAACLDKHITLDPTVPAELGCAEAVSYVLKLAGLSDGSAGIAGTQAMYQWLLANTAFNLTATPVPGDIIISPTGTSTINSPHGHVGIVAKYGVLSNDSDTGLFAEKYTLVSWGKYFHDIEGFPVYYFHAL